VAPQVPDQVALEVLDALVEGAKASFRGFGRLSVVGELRAHPGMATRLGSTGVLALPAGVLEVVLDPVLSADTLDLSVLGARLSLVLAPEGAGAEMAEEYLLLRSEGLALEEALAVLE
jgi:hypothetical protein